MGNEKNDNLWGVVAYLSLLGILLVYFMKKENAFAKYHMKQSIVLLVVSIVNMVIGMIPIIGLISMLGSLAVLALWLLGMWNAFQGKKTPLPFVGQFASKINV